MRTFCAQDGAWMALRRFVRGRSWTMIAAALLAGAPAVLLALAAFAQVIGDPTGNNLFSIGTAGENVSAEYLALSNGGGATTTSSTRSASISTTGPANAQTGEAISLEGSASAVNGEAISGTGSANCGAWTVSVTGDASCGTSNDGVISGTGNATSAASIATISGTGNANNETNSYYGGVWEVAISGTGCASGGGWVTIVVSGTCDADSYTWENASPPMPIQGIAALNFGSGCARNASIDFAVVGCADSSGVSPYSGLADVSVLGPANGGVYAVSGGDTATGPSSAVGGCQGGNVVVSATSAAYCPACSSGCAATPNIIVGYAGASGQGIDMSAVGPANGGTASVSGLGNAGGSELAVSVGGNANACGGPEPVSVAITGKATHCGQ